MSHFNYHVKFPISLEFFFFFDIGFWHETLAIFKVLGSLEMQIFEHFFARKSTSIWRMFFCKGARHLCNFFWRDVCGCGHPQFTVPVVHPVVKNQKKIRKTLVSNSHIIIVIFTTTTIHRSRYTNRESFCVKRQFIFQLFDEKSRCRTRPWQTCSIWLMTDETSSQNSKKIFRAKRTKKDFENQKKNGNALLPRPFGPQSLVCCACK